MEPNHELVKNTVKGTLWNYTSFAASKGITFISTMILARILVPEDFGLLSLGLIAINYLDVLNEMGVGPALIYQQGDLNKKSNVAFSMSLTVNAVLTLIALILAPLVAWFFKEPRVTPIMQALSITFVLSSVGSIHATRLKKELDFRKIFIPEIGKTIAKGLVSILMAVLGYGVWSLVFGQLAGILVANALYWIIAPWRPKFDLDRTIVKSLFQYGSQIILVDLLGMIHHNIDYLIIGRLMNSTQLGYYTMAYRIPELIIINICHVVSKALFPAYAKLQNDLPALQKGFLVTLRFVAIITVPLGIGLFFLSSEFITLFFTEKWADSIPVMQLLCLYAVVYSLSFNAGDIYKAIGRPGILNTLGVIKLIVTIPVLIYAAGISIYAVAMGQLVTNILLTLLKLVIVSKLIKIEPLKIMQSLLPAFIGSLVMTAGLWILSIQLHSAADLLRLIVISLAGVALYSATLWLTNRETVHAMVNMTKSAAKP